MNELELFIAAQSISDPQERSDYLNRMCADNPALRERLEALLAGSAQSQSPLDQSPISPVSGISGPTLEQAHASPSHHLSTQTRDFVRDTPDTVIAEKYTLVELVGEGGMGSVWRAKQSAPVKRQVAIKLIKAGMDSRQVLARFEAERQALALMDHPNIAKVLDGGLHQQRPYFVMELVKGIPITEYCDQHKLNPQQRLELFVHVCQAIQHAHQKGIIHRDIKPSNVLVAMYDDKPVVKVIDFGVAKATGGTLSEQTIDTGLGNIVGTPQYMSPEQATFNNLDIDTRSDVYALGVLLYELLTGSPPFSAKELQKKGLLEMLRVVREEEPPRPSTRLSTADALPTLSANRGIEPKKLTGLLRNELDWIVMKALEKDRTRRYETANGFAADILRYLSGEPIAAHPPSTAYRLSKFVKRNRVQVIAAGLVVSVLVAGVIGTTYGLLEANRQREIADKSANQERLAKLREQERANGEEKAKLEAQANLAFAKKGNEILGSVFSGLDPKSNYATLGELSQALKDNLKKAVKELEGSAIGDPLTVANMQNTLGISLVGLGEPKLAANVLEKSVATRRSVLGTNHAETLASVSNLAGAYRDNAQMDLALPLYQEALNGRIACLGATHRETLASMSNLAGAYFATGQVELAIPMFESALVGRRKALGSNDPDTLSSMNNLASAYKTAGKHKLAQDLYEEALAGMKKQLRPDHPDRLKCMNNLAVVYKAVGRNDLALPLLEESVASLRSKLGADHPDTLVAIHNLALGYNAIGKPLLALPLLEETVEVRKRKSGVEHPQTLSSMSGLASTYQRVGQTDRALPLFEEVLKSQIKVQGADHPNTLSTMNNLAMVYWSTKQFSKSLPLFERLLELREKKLGRPHPSTLLTIANLGVNYRDSGQFEKALPLLEEAYVGRGTNPSLRFIGLSLLDAYVAAGKKFEAIKLANDMVGETRRADPLGNSELLNTLALCALPLLRAGAAAEAESLLRECLAFREKKEPDAWSTFNTQSMLGAALLDQKKAAEAEPLLIKGYEGMKARENSIPKTGGGELRIPEALDRLIELYTATNKPEQAKKYKDLRDKYPKLSEKK